MTFVLVRKTLRPVISRVETSEKGIGLMGFVVSSTLCAPCGTTDYIRATKLLVLSYVIELIKGSCGPSESLRHYIGFRELS
jgi:hypothetical protein